MNYFSKKTYNFFALVLIAGAFFGLGNLANATSPVPTTHSTIMNGGYTIIGQITESGSLVIGKNEDFSSNYNVIKEPVSGRASYSVLNSGDTLPGGAYYLAIVDRFHDGVIDARIDSTLFYLYSSLQTAKNSEKLIAQGDDPLPSDYYGGTTSVIEPVVTGDYVYTPTGYTLRPGMRNSQDVRNLQIALQHLGIYSGVIDGSYGPMTTAAVLQFQQRYQNLTNDGIAGNKTQSDIQFIIRPVIY